VLGPCTRPNPEAEAEAESRRGPRLLRAKTSNPHINRVFTPPVARALPADGILGAVKRHGLAYVDANPRQCRAHATRFGRRRLRFACLDRIGCSQWYGSAVSCSRLQHVLSAAGSFTGGTRLQPSACGSNTFCCCVTPVLLRRGRCPGGRQWWRRCRRGNGFGRGADVGAGRTLSRCNGSTQSSCRCGWGVD
jgi:hypothetical protein